MRIVLGVIASLVLFACGDDDSDSSDKKPQEDGFWFVEINYSSGQFIIIEGNTYAAGLYSKSGNAVSLQRTEGSITYDGTKLNLSPTRSTCEAKAPVEISYTVTDKTLTLAADATEIVFQKVEDDGEESEWSGSRTTGCFDDETGEFTARELADL